MSLILDLILLIIAACTVYYGASRGFIRAAMHLISIIVALVCVFTFTAPLAGYIEDSFIGSHMAEFARTKLTDIIPDTAGASDVADRFNDAPEVFSEIADRFFVEKEKLFSFISEELNGTSDNEAVSKIADMLAEPAAGALSTAVAGLLIFIAAYVVAQMAIIILDKIFKLPILKSVNKLLGIVFGAVSAAVLCWFISAVIISFIEPLSAVNGEIFNDALIDNSVVLSFIEDNGLANIHK